MFGDSLLQVSSASRNNKRWSMATALIVELIIAGLAISIPLLTTGFLPISARVPLYVPIKPVTIDTMRPAPVEHPHANGPAAPASRTVVELNNNPNAIRYGSAAITTADKNEVTPPGNFTSETGIPSDLIAGPNTNVKPGPGPKRRVISQLEEAQLINRVEPVYPHIAIVTGIQGQVKLRAIIARDGRVQSLNVISGHPLLARAALDAVSQWRYRPYVLNGEIVEVETFIMVNFKKNSQ
jgi:protein TonB